MPKNNMKKLGQLKITYELLSSILDLPKEAFIREIVCEWEDRYKRTFKIIVEGHPDLPEVIEGELIPIVTVKFETRCPKFAGFE